MMLRNSLLLFPLFAALFVGSAGAQPSPLVGAYRTSAHHSPEGDAQIFFLPDSTYAVLFFGGARAGRWTVKSDTLVYLTPTDVPPRPVALYGRHHAGLGARARIFYGGFATGTAYISAGPQGTEPALRRVFNENANCTSFPYVDTMDVVPAVVRILVRHYTDTGAPVVYTFANSEGYNDFVAEDLTERWADRSFRADEPFATVRRGGLYLLDARYMAERRPLPERGEDRDMLAVITRVNPAPDSVLFNPLYNGVGSISDHPVDLTTYTPARGGNALVAPDYTEGAEHVPDYDFNDMRILFRFRAMTPTEVRTPRPRLDERPFFRAECD